MKIKEIADKLNISARTIRFYEEKGLLSPHKQAHNQYRSFTEQDVWRLQTIISLREAGMTLVDIHKALVQVEQDNPAELQYYLELQRSVLMSQWLELKQVIETTEHMITLLKNQNSLPLEDIYQLAEGSKKLRDQRSKWKDTWGYDQLALTHDERTASHLGDYADYNQTLDLIVKWVSPIHGEKGLDVGAGTGNLAAKLISHNAQMSAVDQSKEMLRLCHNKYPALETRLGNFLAIPYLGGEFDFVVSSFSFHHLTPEQQLLALAEMRRVLKPYGRICMAILSDTIQPLRKPNDEHSSLSALFQWFENHRYVVKQQQMNECLHVIYAVPL